MFAMLENRRNYEYQTIFRTISEAASDNDVDQFIQLVSDLKMDMIMYSAYVIPVSAYIGDPSRLLREQTGQLSLPTSNITLMHVAAFCDSLDMFIYLMYELNFSLRIASADLYLPLHYAVYGGAKEVAYYILENDPEQAKLETETNHQLLYFAVISGNDEFLSLLLEKGAKLESPANRKDDLVNVAIKKRSISCLKILLKHGCKSRSFGYSSIMLAAMSMNPCAVSLMLESGENPNYISPNNMSALFLACVFKRFDIIMLLCSKMTTFDIPMSIREKSLIHYLCETGNPEIIRYVLGFCKDKNISKIVNRFDKNGRMGPTYLVDKKIPDTTIIEILMILLEYGLDINALPKDDDNHNTGNSIIFYFVRAIIPNLNVIKWLLENGADPYLKSHDGLSAYEACRNGATKKLFDDACLKVEKIN